MGQLPEKLPNFSKTHVEQLFSNIRKSSETLTFQSFSYWCECSYRMLMESHINQGFWTEDNSILLRAFGRERLFLCKKQIRKKSTVACFDRVIAVFDTGYT